jgi:hypothetical protein
LTPSQGAPLSRPADPPPNPYAAPQAELHSPASRWQLFADGALRSWVIVFLLNLPFPILLGWQICDRDGQVGMVTMLALMLAFSSWLVSANRWYGRRLIIGGICVAVSQFFPVLQFYVGMLGMYFVEALGLPPRQNPNNDDFAPWLQLNLPAAMFLTLFGGFVLMLVALGIGSLFSRGEPSNLKQEEATDDERKHYS